LTWRAVGWVEMWCTAAILAACGAATGTTGAPPSIATLAPTSSTTASATARATPAAESGRLPAQVLDLSNWKVTLPVNAAGAFTGAPLEITQPARATYAQEPWFVARRDAVQFRAPVSGGTTSRSPYHRP